jgi:hypothetical protein
MPAGDKLMFHGAAFARIVGHGEFTGLNRVAPRRYGHYRLNDNVVFCVKYSDRGGSRWTFGFSSGEIRELATDRWPSDQRFVVLVCGRLGICTLDRDDLRKVLAIKQTSGQQWIEVTAPSGKSFRVRGSRGRLDRVVPRNAFPGRLFRASRNARR